MNFYAIGINKLIPYWQNMLIVMVPILINKDMFEPSYDLKLVVQKHSCFCISLIYEPKIKYRQS